MKPARFSYEAPTTVEGVLAALAHGNDAKIIAGGQSLAPMMNMRIATPGHLVDINRVESLGGVRLEGEHLVCGALTRHAALARDALVRMHAPMVAHAAETIGHYAIRQRGTLGGSLAHADPAAQLPAVALALDARIEIASPSGRRMVAAAEFFSSVFTTVLEPQELLVAVHLPVRSRGWGFRLFSRRAGDFALALVAGVVWRTQQGVEARLAAGGVAATPVLLEVKPGAGDAGWIDATARRAAAGAPVEENERVPSGYRRELIEALAREALADAVERAP